MKTLSKFSEKTILFLLFLMAFAPIFDKISNFKFAGFSFFVTVLPAIIYAFLYLKNFYLFKKSQHLLLAFNLAFFLLIILSRNAFYGEFSVKTVGSQTYIFLLPICIILFASIKIRERNKRFLNHLFTFILIFNFAIALLYIIGLPTIQIADINSPDYNEFGRFTGIMGGANVQGNFIFLIFMILALGAFNVKLYKIFFLLIISLIAVMPTLSRSSIIGIIFVFFYSIYEHFRRSSLSSKVFLILAIYIFINLFSFWLDFSTFNLYYKSFIARLYYSDISGERIEKLHYAITTLTSDINHMIIGIPIKLQQNYVVSISDNSLTLLLAGFGIPYTLFFIFFIVNLIKDKIILDKKIIVYTLLTSVILLTNNAILWLPWISYTILGYCILKRDIDLIASDK